MPDSTTETAVQFLEHLRRSDLAALLFHSDVMVEATGAEPVVIVNAPQPFADALRALPQYDRRRVAQSIVDNHVELQQPPQDILVKTVGDPIAGPAALLPDLVIQKEVMLDVSTRGRPIREVDDYYGARQVRIARSCAAASIPYENPHGSLWDWYHYWKKNFATYAERRYYIRKLFTDPITAAAAQIVRTSPVTEREPTGWERVDRALARVRLQLETASTEEDYQIVGLLSREILISLAQAVYDPRVHTSEDGVIPSATDVNRMIEAYVRHIFPGKSYKEIRAYARAALAVAVNLQHRRTATRQLAALCLESTASLVATVSIIAGKVS